MEEKIKSPGEDLKFQEQELKAEKVRVVERNKEIVKILNTIGEPVMATIYTAEGRWSIRNIAFWKAMEKKDNGVVEYMEKYLKDA